MHVNLTDVLVRATEPPASGTLTIWDTNLKHFGLRISSGGAKTFILLLGSGHRHAIGRFEPKVFGLGQAREKARQILAERVLGRYQPQTISWKQARNEFLDQVERENRPKTHREYKRALIKYFSFVAKRLADVTKADVSRSLDKLNHAPSMRNRTLVYCKIFFNWCVDRGYLPYNPITMTAKKEKKRSRILSDDELRAIWHALDRGHNLLPLSFIAIVRTLIFTPLRRGECAQTRGEYIQDDLLILPPEVTKNGREHVLPLTKSAKGFLSSSNGFVFPSRTHGKCFCGWSKSKSALDDLCGVSKWTLHDLRRTFRTKLSRLKVAPHIAEMLLNHASARTALEETYDTYNYLDEKRDAMLRYEEHMIAVLSATPDVPACG